LCGSRQKISAKPVKVACSRRSGAVTDESLFDMVDE
jgi:hypothetical protein